MKKLLKIFQERWLFFKIHIRLYYFYPYEFKDSSIKSILPSHLKIQTGTIIEKNVVITDKLQKVGRHVYIGENAEIGACQSIGNFTSIARGVRLGLINHSLNHISTSPIFYLKRRKWVPENTYSEFENGLVIVGNDVLISANALVLSGVKVGDGAVIGAGAFVNKAVPPYAIVAGTPAKIIRYRFDPGTIRKLMDSEWWDLEDKILKTCSQYFNNPEVFVEKINQLKQSGRL